MAGGSTLAFCKKRDPTSISVQATSEATSRRHGLGSSLSQNRTRFRTNGSGTGKNCLGLSERIPNDSRRRRKLTRHSSPPNDRADPDSPAKEMENTLHRISAPQQSLQGSNRVIA